MKKLFIEQLERRFEQSLEGALPLQKAIQERGWKRFLELGLPDKRMAGYQYFPLTPLFEESIELRTSPPNSDPLYDSLIHPDCLHSFILFIDGKYRPELSNCSAVPKGVSILPFHEAIRVHGHFLQMRLAATLQEEKDPMAMLTIACAEKGLFLYVPPQLVVETPIQCLHLFTGDRAVLATPRIDLFLGKGAGLKWICDRGISTAPLINSQVVDVALEEGAHFEQYTFLSPGERSWSFEALRATLKRGSRLRSISYTSGGLSVRQDFRIALAGENSSCDLRGISLLGEGKQGHVNVLVDHKAPHCQSNQLFKNVLTQNGSRSSFEGKIFVRREAQKTEAYQLNHNLILADQALTYSKPNLEIFADDVKASHGATVARLSPSSLFYLQSRGFSLQAARQLLLSGFCLDILADAPIGWLRERADRFAKRYMR